MCLKSGKSGSLRQNLHFTISDGHPSNTLFTYHVTDDKDFTHFEPQTPQYRKLKNGEFTSLTLRITDQYNNIVTDGPQVTIVLHIKYNPLKKWNTENN